MPYIFFTALIGGFVLDLLIGDPHGFPHFVILIGRLITALEKLLRKIFPKNRGGERAAGVVLVILTLLLSGGIPLFLLLLLARIWLPAAWLFELFLCWQIPAVRSLRTESMKVYEALKKGNLEEARYAVSMIVGRDTANLTAEGVIKAAVETVAENTSDGVVAPLLFTALGGCVGGCLYKAVNTMDSMVGYRNEKYRYFGTAAAKLDDIVNFIPARLSALLMIAAAALTGFDVKNAYRIFRRDRLKHASPNSAQTESVCAGALQLQLAGDAWYFGELHKKPTIGDPIRQVTPEAIPDANKLMYATAWLTFGLGVLLRLLLLAVLF
ncbi:MAG: adenosylcobinamide-phosphate synthase CbiB [Lachnospiraceae bacterium]|nr:adenosylcobinamide-phosphate synthase CbiB [Lachnospiraceae bacterium]